MGAKTKVKPCTQLAQIFNLLSMNKTDKVEYCAYMYVCMHRKLWNVLSVCLLNIVMDWNRTKKNRAIENKAEKKNCVHSLGKAKIQINTQIVPAFSAFDVKLNQNKKKTIGM